MEVVLLRGLQVLEALAGMEQPAGLPAVVARTGLSQSQAFRALRSLEQDGYVEHVGRSGYRVGSRAVAMATMIGPRPPLLRAVHPVVSHLVNATGHSVAVHLRTGSDRVLVLGIAAPNDPVRQSVATGERSPLNVGCSGRVILAYLSEEELAGTGFDIAADRLATIRAHGYDISCGENHPGVNGIAGALLEEDGSPLGSVSIAGPATRLPEPALTKLAKPLLAACRDLSPRLSSLLGPDPGATVAALDLTPTTAQA